MNLSTNKSRLWVVLWALVSTVSIGLGTFVTIGGWLLTRGKANSFWINTLLSATIGLICGCVVGRSQWLILRRWMKGQDRWTLATSASWLLGTLVSNAISERIIAVYDDWISAAAGNGTLTDAMWAESIVMPVLVTIAVTFLFIGLTVGLGQWLVWRHWTKHARWWWLNYFAGWLIGGLAGFLVANWPGWEIGVYVVTGSVFAVITGITLVSVLSHLEAKPTTTDSRAIG